MKIVYVVESLAVGGAEKVSVMLANLFGNNKHEVSMLVINGPNDLQEELNDIVTVHHLQRKMKLDPLKMARASHLIRDADIVHCHMKGAYRYIAFIKKLFFISTPVIFHDHNGDIDLNPPSDYSLKFFLKPQYYIAVNKGLQQWGIHKLNIPVKNTYLLRNTVPKMDYSETVTNNGRIIMVSNFRSTKNIEFAIALMQHLEYELDIFGKINDHGYFKSVIALADRYGVSNRVNIITGSGNIRSELNSYALAIHTAKSESGPLVLLEYLNAGLPFVSFKTGEVVSQLGEQFKEMTMDNFDVEEWVKRIQYFMKNQTIELRASLREVFESKFSEQLYYENCLGIYKDILN